MAYKTPLEFHTSFPEDLRQALVQAVQRGYHASMEAQQSYEGFNSWAFGCATYSAILSELSELSESFDLELDQAGLQFQAKVGAFDLMVHKVANSTDYLIEQCFPKNQGSPEAFPKSTYLPGFEPQPERLMVLAHAGNQDDGLIGLYLCSPLGRDSRGRINEWGFIHELYSVNDDSLSIPLDFKLSPPEVEIPDPIVKRKAHKEVQLPRA